MIEDEATLMLLGSIIVLVEGKEEEEETLRWDLRYHARASQPRLVVGFFPLGSPR